MSVFNEMRAVLAKSIWTKMTIQVLMILLYLTRACQAQAQGGVSARLPEVNNYDYEYDYQPIDQWQQRFNQAKANTLNNVPMQKRTFHPVDIKNCLEKARRDFKKAMRTSSVEVTRNGKRVYNGRQRRSLYHAVKTVQMSNCINPPQNKDEYQNKINKVIFEEIGGLGRAIGRQLRTVSQDIVSKLGRLEKLLRERKRRKKEVTIEENSEESSVTEQNKSKEVSTGESSEATYSSISI